MRFTVAAFMVFALVTAGLLAGDTALSAQVKKKEPAKTPAEEAPEPNLVGKSKSENDVLRQLADQRKLDRETLQQAGLAADAKSLLQFFEKHTVTDADRIRITHLIKQLGDIDFDVREAATTELIKYGVGAIGLLRQAGDSPDQEISLRCDRVLRTIEKVPTRTLAVAASRILAELKPEGTTQTLMNYLPLADDDAVTEEIRNTLAALAVKDGKEDKFLKETLDNKEVLKRGVAAEAPGAGWIGRDPPGDPKVLRQRNEPRDQVANRDGIGRFRQGQENGSDHDQIDGGSTAGNGLAGRGDSLPPGR